MERGGRREEAKAYGCRVARTVHGNITAAIDNQKVDRLSGDVGDAAAHRAAQITELSTGQVRSRQRAHL